MADSETDKSNKTLEPTEKKLRDLRKKGDIPSSRETGNLMVVVSLAAIGAFTLPSQANSLVELFTQLFEMSGRIDVGDSSAGLSQLSIVFKHFVVQLGIAVSPIFAVFIGGAIIGIIIRGETAIAVQRIAPKLSNISPASGLKRLFSADTLVEFTKSLLKVLVVGVFAVWITHQAVSQIWITPGFLPENLPGYISLAAIKLLMIVTAFLAPLTVLDIIWKRFDWIRKNRMSHKEVKDEHKETEGTPEIKAKRAQIRRQLTGTYLAKAVPEATVVLTNPTRLAIALKYEKGSDDAPVCVAKGADHMARRIRQIAHDESVPMIENIPLTRALYEVIDVDTAVPTEHWAVLAEIIGFVYDLEHNRMGKLPPHSELVLHPE